MKAEETRMGMGMMYEMMQNMMKGTGSMSGSMPEMCMKMMEQMMGSMNKSAKISDYATTEMRVLFDEWLNNLEEETIAFVKEKGKVSPDDVASRLKISKESALFIIGKLAREGKLSIGEIKLA
ncbi:MAG: hypothetical protein QXP27_01550 [Candidatus Methanomethyliaceae archaeon]